MSQMVIGEGKEVRKADADISRFFKVIHKGENNAPVVDCEVVDEIKLQNFDSPNNTYPAEQPTTNSNPVDGDVSGSRKKLFPLITKAARKDNSLEQLDKPSPPLLFVTSGAKKAGGGRATRCPNTTPKPRKASASSPRKPKAARAGGKRKVEDVVLVSYSDFLQNNAAAAAASERSVPKEDVYQYDSDEEDAGLGIVKIDYRKAANKQKCITKYFSTNSELANGGTGGKPTARKYSRGGKMAPGVSRGRGRPRGSTSKANKCNGEPPVDVAEVKVTKSGRAKSAKRSKSVAGRTEVPTSPDELAGTSVRRSHRVRSHTDLFDASNAMPAGGGSRRCSSRAAEDVPAAATKPATTYQVSVINEKGGKQCIRLRLTRVGQQSEKAKFVVGTAQRLLNKAKLNKEAAATKKPVKRFTKIKKTASQDAPKKPLAQIFLNAKTKTDVTQVAVVEDEAVQQRRQDFLQSGIPEKLRRQISISDEVISNYSEFLFPTVSHVQQLDADLPDTTPPLSTAFGEMLDVCRLPVANADMQYGTLTNCADVDESRDFANYLISEQTTLSYPDALNKIAASCEMQVNVFELLDSYRQRRHRSLVTDKPSGNPNGDSLLESSDSEILELPATEGVERGQRAGLKRGRKGTQEAANKRPRSEEEENDCVVLDAVADRTDDASVEGGASLPDSMWTSVYRPRCSGEVLDNRESMDALRTWLLQWRAINATKSKGDSRKRVKRKGVDGDESSDDSDNEESGLCNTALLAGSSGCGKTSAVYALAEELGFTVLEVNASSRRSGKQITNRLREATQSRHVKESSVNPQNAIASMFANATGRKTLKSQSVEDYDVGSQGSGTSGFTSTSCQSLILFEDVDLLFADDDGFWSAVNNFMASAKTPIVLTTCDSKFGDKGCIRGNYKEILFHHPDTRLQTLHLQLMCLAESHYVHRRELALVVAHHVGNYRQAINTLQYLLKRRASDSYSASPSSAFENLMLSAVSLSRELPFSPLAEAFVRKTSKDVRMNLFSLYGAPDSEIAYTGTLTLLSSYVARTEPDQPSDDPFRRSNTSYGVARTFRHGGPFLDARSIVLATAADMLDNFSTLDTTLRTGSRTTRWCELLPGLDDVPASFDEGGNHCSQSLQSEIGAWLQQARYDQALATLGDGGHAVPVTSRLCPDLDYDYRTRHSAAINATRTVVTGALPIGVQHCSEAVSLDYLPCLRDICRTERIKQSGVSMKRGGRYSHYLCSSVLYLEPATVAQLCDDLLDKL